MFPGDLKILVTIMSILVSVGVAWGYTKTKLNDLDTRCGDRRTACQKQICSKVDTLLRSIDDLKKSNNELSSEVQKFMLEVLEWKGTVSQRLNNDDRRIIDLEEHIM